MVRREKGSKKTACPQKISSSQQGETKSLRQDDLHSQADSRRVDTCKFCKHDFVGEDVAQIICERCDVCVCVPCANFSPSEYGILQRSTRFHWFCEKCENPAMSAVKEDRPIKEKCSALFQIFRQEIQLELKSEILELRTEIKKLKIKLVEKQVTETTASEGCHQIKMISEVANGCCM